MTDATTPTPPTAWPTWLNPEPLEGLRAECEAIREAADALHPQVERLMRRAHDAERAASEAERGVPDDASDGASALVSAMVGDRVMRRAVQRLTSDLFDAFERRDWPAAETDNGRERGMGRSPAHSTAAARAPGDGPGPRRARRPTVRGWLGDHLGRGPI